MENNFGNFLKQKRQEKGLTQKDLAKLLYVSDSAVSKWEKNVAHPDICLLPKLSDILGVSEREIITASIDQKAQEEKRQAKKWRTLSFSWSLFFYISYAVALIPCFICDLAINKTLSWFWIVLSALLLAFSFTNLPNLIKRNKLFFLPLLEFLSLCLLLGVCAIYSNGNWFFIACLSVLLGLVIIFVPIYISKYEIFSKIRKYGDFISIGVDFIMLNILLIVINGYTATNGFSSTEWYLIIALPIVLYVYFVLNALLLTRFLKTNKFIKTGIVLILSSLSLYAPPLFINPNNPSIKKELDEVNVFRANLSNWNPNTNMENNIHLIALLSVLTIAVVFLAVGILHHVFLRRNKPN